MKFSNYNIIIPGETEDDTLLANTVSGSVFRVDPKERERIESRDLSHLSPEMMEKYKSHGILVEDSRDERGEILVMQDKQKYDPSVLSLTVLLTNGCNFACTYCYEGQNKNFISLTDDVRNRIYFFIERMFELRKGCQQLYIMLFGGEPLLHFQENVEWLYRIKALCGEKQKEFSTGIVTNGSLLTPQIIGQLKDFNCNSIQFTLDGSKEVHDARRFYQDKRGSFDDVLAAIQLACNTEHFVTPSIRINVDRLNIDSIEDLLKRLSKENLLEKCFVYFGILREGQEKDIKEAEMGVIMKPMWELLKKYECHFNVRPSRRPLYCGLYRESSYTVTPEGDVYKCWELVGDEEYKIGSLDETGNLQVLDSYFHWMSRDFRMIEECFRCPYLPICGGGCAAVSKRNHGTIHAAGCLETKGAFDQQIRFYFGRNSA